MTGWWANTEFRAGTAAFGAMAVGIAAFLTVLSAVADVSWALIVFLPLGLLLLLTAILIVMVQPWRHAGDIKAMLAGNAWVHWTYDEAGWRVANQYDERTYKRWVRGTAVAVAVSVFLLLVGVLGGKGAIDVAILGGIGTLIASAAPSRARSTSAGTESTGGRAATRRSTCAPASGTKAWISWTARRRTFTSRSAYERKRAGAARRSPTSASRGDTRTRLARSWRSSATRW
jgi:hypothetical protein